MEKLLTAAEAAVFLGVRRSTVYAWAIRRRIPSLRISRFLRFSPRELDGWLEQQRWLSRGRSWWWTRCHTCGYWIAWDHWRIDPNDFRTFCPKHLADVER